MIFSNKLLAIPPGLSVLINAAAPTKVGKTSGRGRINLSTLRDGRSVRIVNQARPVPRIAADKVTNTVRFIVLIKGERVCSEKRRPSGSESLVIFLQIRYKPGHAKRKAVIKAVTFSAKGALWLCREKLLVKNSTFSNYSLGFFKASA